MVAGFVEFLSCQDLFRLLTQGGGWFRSRRCRFVEGGKMPRASRFVVRVNTAIVRIGERPLLHTIHSLLLVSSANMSHQEILFRD
jgi:hypothetical protein